jgi:hypothetical protein
MQLTVLRKNEHLDADDPSLNPENEEWRLFEGRIRMRMERRMLAAAVPFSCHARKKRAARLSPVKEMDATPGAQRKNRFITSLL